MIWPAPPHPAKNKHEVGRKLNLTVGHSCDRAGNNNERWRAPVRAVSVDFGAPRDTQP